MSHCQSKVNELKFVYYNMQEARTIFVELLRLSYVRRRLIGKHQKAQRI